MENADDVLNSLGDALIATNLQGNITWMNPVAETLTGYHAADVKGKSLDSILHIVNLITGEKVSNLVVKILAKGMVTWKSGDVKMTCKDKAGFPIAGSAAPILDPLGNASGIVLVFRNLRNGNHVEEAIRVALTKYETLFSSFPLGITVSDKDGNILETNSIAEELLGITGEEQMNRQIDSKEWRIIRPDGSPMPAEEFASVRALKSGQKIENVEMGIVRPDKTITWINVTAAPIPLAQFGVVITYHDISERRKAEEDLKHSEMLLREMGRIAMVGGWELDVATMVEKWTDETFSIHDRERTTYVPDPNIEISRFEPGSRELIDAAFKAALTQGKPYDLELEMITVKENRKWVRAVCSPLINDGKVTRLFGTLQDITEHRLEEEKLQEMNRTLEERVKERTAQVQDLYDNAPAGYHSLDAKGRIIQINQTELNWFGYSLGEMTGRPFTDFLTPGCKNVFETNFPLFLEQGWIHDLEFELVRKNGTTFPVLVSATAIKDEAGNYVMSRSTVYDHTDRKQAEEALRKANADLEHALRIKDEFLANMSHELRTPLNAILGFSESMIRNFFGPLNERQTRSVKTIEKSGRHLLELINDILDLSKLEAKQLKLEPTEMTASDVCESSLSIVREEAVRKNISLTGRIDPLVRVIRADGLRLRQMLINLLNNAVKFTPEGGEIVLHVTGNPDNHTVSFSVIDTGIGIAPGNIERLFQPFVQLDSGLTRRYEGTGLGLVLVERMARLHGGRVTVQSEPGKGSRFTIILPWTESEHAISYEPDSSPEEQPELRLSRIDDGSHLILVAEDNEDNMAMLTAFLLSTGYRVASAKDGIEALRQARLLRPSLILMDLQMPVMDGLETIRYIRREPDPQIAAIPVIVLTALAMTGDRERSLEAGANEYLSKPVSLEQLAELIWQFIPTG